jgi:hypothetical protein
MTDVDSDCDGRGSRPHTAYETGNFAGVRRRARQAYSAAPATAASLRRKDRIEPLGPLWGPAGSVTAIAQPHALGRSNGRPRIQSAKHAAIDADCNLQCSSAARAKAGDVIRLAGEGQKREDIARDWGSGSPACTAFLPARQRRHGSQPQ